MANKYYKFKDIMITPMPIQRPMSAYVASFSKPSIELAGRLGYGVIVAPFAAAMTFGGLSEVNKLYGETAAKYGQTKKKLMCSYFIHFADNPKEDEAARAVADDFEARFSAIRRHYRYIIDNRRAPLALTLGRAWHVKWPLDAEAMHAAAQHLLGRHDFTTFRASECQANSPVRTLERLDVRRVGARIEIEVSARSFLHNQVRSMAGSLEHVGAGKWDADDLAAALAAQDRAR